MSRAIRALANCSAALYERLHGASVKDVARILRRHFGELLLFEEIGCATGSRANGQWIVADADCDGEGLVPLRVHLQYKGGFGGPNRSTPTTLARPAAFCMWFRLARRARCRPWPKARGLDAVKIRLFLAHLQLSSVAPAAAFLVAE